MPVASLAGLEKASSKPAVKAAKTAALGMKVATASIRLAVE